VSAKDKRATKKPRFVFTQEQSRTVVDVVVRCNKNWQNVLDDAEIKKMGVTKEQIKGHINYLRRKDKKKGKGDKHRDDIFKQLDQLLDDDKDVDGEKLEPDEPSSTSSEVQDERVQALKDLDKGLLKNVVDSGKMKDEDEFEKFAEGTKQGLRQTRIQAKAEEKSQMVDALRNQRDTAETNATMRNLQNMLVFRMMDKLMTQSESLGSAPNQNSPPQPIRTSPCRNCGGQLEPGFCFCPHCSNPTRSNMCKSCPTLLSQAWTCCPKCGTKVDQ